MYLCILKCPVHMDSSEEHFIMVLAPQSTTQPFLIHAFLCLFIESRPRGHVSNNEPAASIGIFPSWAVCGLTGARWVQVSLWGVGAVTWAGERYWKLRKGRWAIRLPASLIKDKLPAVMLGKLMDWLNHWSNACCCSRERFLMLKLMMLNLEKSRGAEMF